MESAKFKVIKGHKDVTFTLKGVDLYFILITGIVEPQEVIKSVPRFLCIPVFGLSNPNINHLWSRGKQTTKIMKPTFSIFTKAIILCSFFFCVQAVKASDMYDLIKKGQLIIALLESQDEEIVRAEYDLIHKGSPKTIYRTLSSDYTYTITGFASSDRIDDLDIVVYKKVNGSWVEEVKDTKTDSTPMVNIKPSYSREYKIVVKAYSWKSSYDVSCYGLIVSHN